MGAARLADGRTLAFDLEVVDVADDGDELIALAVGRWRLALRARCTLRAYAEALDALAVLFEAPVVDHVPSLPKRRRPAAEAAGASSPGEAG